MVPVVPVFSIISVMINLTEPSPVFFVAFNSIVGPSPFELPNTKLDVLLLVILLNFKFPIYIVSLSKCPSFAYIALNLFSLAPIFITPGLVGKI